MTTREHHDPSHPPHNGDQTKLERDRLNSVVPISFSEATLLQDVASTISPAMRASFNIGGWGFEIAIHIPVAESIKGRKRTVAKLEDLSAIERLLEKAFGGLSKPTSFVKGWWRNKGIEVVNRHAVLSVVAAPNDHTLNFVRTLKKALEVQLREDTVFIRITQVLIL